MKCIMNKGIRVWDDQPFKFFEGYDDQNKKVYMLFR